MQHPKFLYAHANIIYALTPDRGSKVQSWEAADRRRDVTYELIMEKPG
jgi:hypothetical protein